MQQVRVPRLGPDPSRARDQNACRDGCRGGKRDLQRVGGRRTRRKDRPLPEARRFPAEIRGPSPSAAGTAMDDSAGSYGSPDPAMSCGHPLMSFMAPSHDPASDGSRRNRAASRKGSRRHPRFAACWMFLIVRVEEPETSRSLLDSEAAGPRFRPSGDLMRDLLRAVLVIWPLRHGPIAYWRYGRPKYNVAHIRACIVI